MRTLILGILILALLTGCSTSLPPSASISDAVTTIDDVEPYGQWSFDLAGRAGVRQEFPLSLDKAGLLHADLRRQGDADARLALIVYRQDTPGAYARTDGAAPHLRLYWTMPARLVATTAAEEWRLAVVNVGGAPVEGQVAVQLEPLPAP